MSMGVNDPRGTASLDRRGIVGRIYVDSYTEYIRCGLQGFREDILTFSHYKSMGANDHKGVANLDSRRLIGRIYVGDH